MGCKCDSIEMQFSYSHKLRVPELKNKVRFRKFLDDCPQFVNMVEEYQRPAFRKMLEDLKYYNKKINCQEWTFIKH